MIRRSLLLAACVGLCFGAAADAADLPALKGKSVVHHVTPAQVKPAKQPVRKSGKPVKSAVKLTNPLPAAVTAEAPIADSEIQDPADTAEVNLSWVLDPLVANADGSKNEDSASAEANLVVDQPGLPTPPYMVIELSGHVIKTPQSTVRIDVQIGKTHRTVSWQADEIHAGRFKIELKELVPDGKLPAYYPVSALAFVTKAGASAAAMISLEKIVVRMGKMHVAATQ